MTPLTYKLSGSFQLAGRVPEIWLWSRYKLCTNQPGADAKSAEPLPMPTLIDRARKTPHALHPWPQLPVSQPPFYARGQLFFHWAHHAGLALKRAGLLQLGAGPPSARSPPWEQLRPMLALSLPQGHSTTHDSAHLQAARQRPVGGQGA